MPVSSFLKGVTTDTSAARAVEADRKASTDRLAATLVRRVTAARHQHSGEPGCWCRHRNCWRDLLLTSLLLEALGLTGLPEALPSDYETALDWGTLEPSEADLLLAVS